MDTPSVHKAPQQLALARRTSITDIQCDDASRYVDRAIALFRRGHLVEANDDAFRAGYFGPSDGRAPRHFQGNLDLLDSWVLGLRTAIDESVFGMGYAFPHMTAPADIEACQDRYEAFERGRVKGREHADIFKRDIDKLYRAFQALDAVLAKAAQS